MCHAWFDHQPRFDLGMLSGAAVIDNAVNVQISGQRLICSLTGVMNVIQIPMENVSGMANQ